MFVKELLSGFFGWFVLGFGWFVLGFGWFVLGLVFGFYGFGFIVLIGFFGGAKVV